MNPIGQGFLELCECNSLIRHIPAASQANALDGNENAAVAAIDQRSALLFAVSGQLSGVLGLVYA
jgi:hypothetical protein